MNVTLNTIWQSQILWVSACRHGTAVHMIGRAVLVIVTLTGNKKCLKFYTSPTFQLNPKKWINELQFRWQLEALHLFEVVVSVQDWIILVFSPTIPQNLVLSKNSSIWGQSQSTGIITSPEDKPCHPPESPYSYLQMWSEYHCKSNATWSC